MNISKKLNHLRTIALLAVVLCAFQSRSAPSRSSCSGSTINFSTITNLSVSIPNSVNCGGPGNTGPIATEADYVVPGCRGCKYRIYFDFEGSVETVRTESSMGTGTGPEYFGIGIKPPGSPAFSGDPSILDSYFFVENLFDTDTNTPCGSITYQASDTDNFTPLDCRGGDTIALIYYAIDGTNHSGLAAHVLTASLVTNYDDAGDITFDVESLPADGKSTAHALVTNLKAFPDNVRTWQIDGGTNLELTLGCTIDTNGVITAGKVPGNITVRAYCSDMPDCWIEENLKVGCSTCQSGCTDGDVSCGSVLVSINAGNTAYGQSAGLFRINEAYPSTALSTPAILKYYSGGLTTNDVTVARSNGIVQKVFAPQISANVVSNSAYQYQILFYTNSSLTGTPVTTWTIQNPDGATSSNRLTVAEATGGLTNEYDYAWDGTLNGWELTSAGGTKKEKRYSSTNGVVRTEVHLIRDQSNNIKFQETNTYQNFSWSEELTQRTIGSGTNALTTTWAYYTNATDTADYSRLQQVIYPGGKWERYTYDSTGRPLHVVTQYLDASPPTFGSGTEYSANRVTDYSYSAGDVQIFTYLFGYETSWTHRQFFSDHTIETHEQTAGAYYDPTYDLHTTTWKNLTAPFIGEPAKVLMPDGTMSFYSYALSADGNYRTNTVTTGQPDGGQSYIADGTETVTVINKAGNLVLLQRHDIASGLLTSSATTLATDTRGRPIQVQYLDGTTESTVYGCCGIESFTDREGITTTYNYDSYTKAITTVTRAGIATAYTYDSTGNLVQTSRFGTDASEVVQNVSTFDTAGRLISSTPADNGSGQNQTTTYSEYFDGSGHRINTTAYPDGGTRLETYYQDGSLLSVTGTGVHPLRYYYGFDPGAGEYGELTEEVKTGPNGEEDEWVDTYRDTLGRNFLTVFAAPSGQSTPYIYSYFNTIGQMVARQDQDNVQTLFSYNAKGQLEYTAMDMNQNGQMDFAGLDRVTRTVSDVTTDNGATVSRTRTYVWATNGVNASNLITTVETSVDSLATWNVLWNGGLGVTNKSVTFYAGGGDRYVTNAAPDGSFSINHFQSDLLTSVTSKDSGGSQIGQISYAYDAHGRQYQATDARTGTTTYGFNNADQITSVTTPAPTQITSIYFDAMGRVWKTTLPDSTSVTNEFYANGDLKRTYGSRTYPVAYGYDSQGRVTTMTNWTSFAAGIGTRVTTWKYDGNRGFLTNKVYDGNAAGPVYTYTGSGKLKTRKWARNITTSYGYNTADDLQTVTYSDGTPGVTNVYDRFGRQTAVTNGATICIFAFNDANKMLSETYSGGILAGLSITNSYDSLLRRTALALSSQPSTLAGFGYDAASRLHIVTNGNQSVTYGYLANSPLVQTLTFSQSATTRLTTTKSYDNLNRLTSMSSSSSSSVSPSFAYAYNSANQRTAITNADNSHWVYTYDNLGQVTSGKKYWNDGTPVAGQQFTYGFDEIGNRTNTASGGDENGSNLRSATYSANNLNQYTNRTVPGYANILSSANSNATVTTWGTNLLYVHASRKGNYFRAEIPLNNSNAAVWLTLTNLAVLNNGTNADIISTNIGNVYLAQTPEQFTWDADGNLTSDGRWTNTWNGENQFLSVKSISAVADAAKKKLDFSYDSQGRRTQKILSTWNGSGYVAQSTNKFLYDGRNLIAVLNQTNGLLYSFTWGTDLSGTMNRAGGIGGLISMTVYSGANTGTYFYCFDGSGNVVALVNAADGTIAAQYEYDPFLNVLRATGGPLAKVNPFLGASKFYDWETGFYNFGYRYYDPSTGRWLNRDPLQEQGGQNLYAFANNSSVNYVDVDGRFVAGLDELFNFGFLAFDIATGAGVPTIAMDVAAIAIPYVPNPKLLKFITPQTIKKVINGVETEFEITKATSLAKAASIEKDLTQGNNNLKLTLLYKGRAPNSLGNYPKHFQGFSWTEGEIARETEHNRNLSLWMPRMDDSWVQTQVNEALKAYIAEHPHPSLDTLDGFIYDIALPGADKDPILNAFSKAGYSQGQCTSRIELSVGQNGDIHAYPTLKYPK